MQPRISVIMPSYNSARYITEAIYSVLTQSVTDIELIVIDDASTDDTVGIVEKISGEDGRVTLLRAVKNGGPAAARNLGLDQARGDWISIMDSDDLMQPTRLQRLIALAEQDGADIVADDLLLFWENRSSVPELHLALSQPITVNAVDLVTNANKLGYLKPIFRSATLDNLRYNEQLTIAEDLDYYMRSVIAGAIFKVYPVPGYFYRKHGSSISSTEKTRYLETMLEASIAFRKEFAKTGPLARACHIREKHLRSAIRYADLIDLLTKNKFLKAAALIFRYPSALGRLDAPIKVRLNRLRQRLRSNLSPPDPVAKARSKDLQAEVDQILLDVKGFGARFAR